MIILSKDYSEFGLPDIPTNLTNLNEAIYNLADEIQAGDSMIESLNREQRMSFDTILTAVNDESLSAKCFFLDGPGGSGKTYLYTTFLHYFRGRNEVILPAASTGIAANLLIGGRTFHSLYKMPIPILETSVSNMTLNSRDASRIREAKLLIIDECTMASSHALNTIDKLLREIMDGRSKQQRAEDAKNKIIYKGEFFGGKVLLLGGDFRQCLSIVPHAPRPVIVEHCLKNCKAWREEKFKTLSLISNMRSEDPTYSEWLLKLGDGSLKNDYDLGDGMIEIPKQFICDGSLVNEIFGERISEGMIPPISKRAILCPKNKDVDEINDEIISLLEGNDHVYLSDDQVITEDDEERSNYQIEFLNTIRLSGWPTHKLTLRKGTIIMLLRNLNTKKGLCNGTRLLITDLKEHVIKADVLTENGTGQTILIPRIDFNSNATDLPFKLRRRQFPIKPAFAMTINKSQGQTLDKVGIYLADPVFGHGQLYVAFSRVRRACDVKVKIIESSEQGKLVTESDSVFTRNVVFKEVFTLNESVANTPHENR